MQIEAIEKAAKRGEAILYKAPDGRLAVVSRDDFPESPREWDNLGTLVTFPNRYLAGEAQPSDFGLRGLSRAEDREVLEAKAFAALPLYLYVHSGMSVSTGSFNDPWDSGQVGWIAATREAVKKAFGWKNRTKKRIAKIQEALRGEVETLDRYCRGEVYALQVFSAEGESEDFVGGFYDDPDDIVEAYAGPEFVQA